MHSLSEKDYEDIVDALDTIIVFIEGSNDIVYKNEICSYGPDNHFDCDNDDILNKSNCNEETINNNGSMKYLDKSQQVDDKQMTEKQNEVIGNGSCALKSEIILSDNSDSCTQEDFSNKGNRHEISKHSTDVEGSTENLHLTKEIDLEKTFSPSSNEKQIVFPYKNMKAATTDSLVNQDDESAYMYVHDIIEKRMNKFWDDCKNDIEKIAQRKANEIVRNWKREGLTLQDAIETSLKEYADLYERAIAVKQMLDDEKYRIVTQQSLKLAVLLSKEDTVSIVSDDITGAKDDGADDGNPQSLLRKRKRLW